MLLNASESADGFVNGPAGAGVVVGGVVNSDGASGRVNEGAGGASCLITILAGILICGGNAGAGAGLGVGVDVGVGGLGLVYVLRTV